MAKKQTQKFGLRIMQLSMMIILSLIAVLSLISQVNAQESVPAKAEVGDPDCYWSDGPGTELYVPSGKTCTIDFDVTATNVTGWTNYAVIVYSGGTLEIVDNGSISENFTIDGDMYVMGTVNIGDTSSAYDTKLDIINSGNLTVSNNSAAIMTLNNNAGAGQNYMLVSGTTYVGTAAYPTNPTLSLASTSTLTSFEKIDIHAYMRILAGTVTASGVEVIDGSSGGSELVILNGATLTIDSYFNPLAGHPFSGYDCSLIVGPWADAGSATVTVNGTLQTPTLGGVDVWTIIGSTLGASKAKMVVGSTGVVNLQETTGTWTDSDTLTGPSNALWVLSVKPYGLEVQGVLNTYMHLLNNGFIYVTGGSGQLIVNESYRQASDLSIGAGDSMLITQMADIDGDAAITGTLTVHKCTKVTNSSIQIFDIKSTGIFITNDADAGCTLTNTSANDGLNVQGTDTTFRNANGSLGIGDQTAEVTYGDFRVNNGASVEANGFITVEDDLIVEGGSTVTMTDTDSGDNFEADNVKVEPSGVGVASTLTIQADSVFNLNVGAVNIGTISTSTGTNTIDVYGTMNIPVSSTFDFNVADYGQLIIEAGGTVNDNAGSGEFLIDGGVVRINGASGNAGTLYIADQGLQMNNNATNADLRINEYGVLTSEATPASGFGLIVDSGIFDIRYHGEATFDDQIDINTSDGLGIAGYLEGTNNIYEGCTGTKCKVEPSGEIKVVTGTGTPTIKIEQPLNLLGKLNGDDGAGNVYVASPNGDILSVSPGSENSYFYIIANDLTIDSGTTIDASAFENCYNPVGTQTYGGSFGGEGQGGNTETFGYVQDIFTPSYPGTPNPVGMCGFDGSTETVTSFGGGAVFIDVYNDITVNGEIRADGEHISSDDSGGGSGGLVVINHLATHNDTGADFTGSANIQANGANADGTTDSYGGGGGRVIINSILFEEPDDDNSTEPHYKYTGGVYAIGGESLLGAGDYAASGTIVYLGDDNNPDGTLIVDQGNRSVGASGKVTNITSSGNFVFDRIEARNNAYITFDTAPSSDPVGCFKDSTSLINLNGATCAATHDKPDTLYVNDSYAGALTGDEPWWNFNPPDGVIVGDSTPEFSLIYRNPEDGSQEGQYVLFEVDDSSDFSSPLWSAADANNPVLITNVGEGVRTQDIEYGGAALSGGTIYYIRAAFSDSSGATRGLWTHRDMGNYYQFKLDPSYMEISNDCSDIITVETGTATPLKYSLGKMYGSGTCTFTLTSTNTGWKLYYSRISDGATLNDGTGSYVWAPIENAGAVDCEIDPSSTIPEEEYGFNITNLTGFGTSTVNGDGALECNQSFNNTSYVFDIETLTNKDVLIENNTNTLSGATLDLVIHAGLDVGTVPETYELDTIMILSDTP